MALVPSRRKTFKSRAGLESNDACPSRLPRGRGAFADEAHHLPEARSRLTSTVPQGQLPYKDLAEMLERGRERLEECQRLSQLPDKADLAEAKKFVAVTCATEILEAA